MSVTLPQRWPFDEDLESKYEIINALGGGGMGRVLHARHRQLRRSVAIKLLHQDLRDSESVTRFLREARAAAQIRSSHVAHVMDAGLLRSGQPYIVMEYLQGQDLARMVAQRGRLPVDLAIDIVLQALEALAEAHSLEIIHRDIKPGNLFATRGVDGDLTIKVLDFGLAKTSPTLDTLDPAVTERGAVLGTPSYMAPEQFVDAQNVDGRADIWGIGATLFELLTGRPPITGTNLPQVYAAVMHQPIPMITESDSHVSGDLGAVVAKCLTRERDGRYANVAELAEALESYAEATGSTRVARIRRIYDGVRESSDLIDSVVSGERERTNELLSESSFALRQLDGRSQSPSPKRLKHKLIWAALLVVLAGIATSWTMAARRPEAAATRSATDRTQSIYRKETAPPVVVSERTKIPATELKANVEPTVSIAALPTPTKAEPVAHPVVKPDVPKRTVERIERSKVQPTANLKASPPASPQLPEKRIYEKYP
jgi:serine/threonine protein kinase